MERAHIAAGAAIEEQDGWRVAASTRRRRRAARGSSTSPTSASSTLRGDRRRARRADRRARRPARRAATARRLDAAAHAHPRLRDLPVRPRRGRPASAAIGPARDRRDLRLGGASRWAASAGATCSNRSSGARRARAAVRRPAGCMAGSVMRVPAHRPERGRAHLDARRLGVRRVLLGRDPRRRGDARDRGRTPAAARARRRSRDRPPEEAPLLPRAHAAARPTTRS